MAGLVTVALDRRGQEFGQVLIDINVECLDDDGQAHADASPQRAEHLVEQPRVGTAPCDINAVAVPVANRVNVGKKLATSSLDRPERVPQLGRLALLDHGAQMFTDLSD